MGVLVLGSHELSIELAQLVAEPVEFGLASLLLPHHQSEVVYSPLEVELEPAGVVDLCLQRQMLVGLGFKCLLRVLELLLEPAILLALFPQLCLQTGDLCGLCLDLRGGVLLQLRLVLSKLALQQPDLPGLPDRLVPQELALVPHPLQLLFVDGRLLVRAQLLLEPLDLHLAAIELPVDLDDVLLEGLPLDDELG